MKLPSTTALPLVDDFSSYTVTHEHEFLRLPGNYWTITPKLPEQIWRVSNVNGFSCIQFSYSTDLKYRQTLVSRPLTAPAGRNVKLSLGYAGNTYIYTLAETECMNIEYSLDGGESWLAVDQIRYKSNTALTHVDLDLTEKVAGKTFMLRFKGSGAEPENNYNWQLTDIKESMGLCALRCRWQGNPFGSFGSRGHTPDVCEPHDRSRICRRRGR